MHRLATKLRTLREVEGACRGLPGPLSRSAVVRLIREELGERISLAYVSQLETGTRVHMTNQTRLLLARFFRVHPGYLVDEPETFQATIATPLPEARERLATWLRAGAERFREDPEVAEALGRLADHPERRETLRLVRAVLARPGLQSRLLHALEAPRG